MPNVPASDAHPVADDRRRASPLALLLACSLSAIVGLIVVGLHRTTALTLVIEGFAALLLLAVCGGWGAWPAALLAGWQRGMGVQLGLAVTLGSGLTALFTLVTGLLGWLHAGLALGWVVGGAVLGAAWVLRRHVRPGMTGLPLGARDAKQILYFVACCLPLAIPAGVACVGAALPPGLLWFDEARGYDVLEYHLQVPREWFELGRIEHLPHNVYASFPQQMEMLYLFLMVLEGDVYAAAVPAQCTHMLFAALSVGVIASLVRRRGAADCAVVVTGAFLASVPWLVYGGVLAYVEGGVLLFAAVSAALLLECLCEPRPAQRNVLAAGLCAGLAAGCKYTAIVLVVIGLASGWLVACRAAGARRWISAGVFLLGALAGVAPWLLRNAAFTGNPIYPFAYKLLGGRDWSSQQAAQWERGHHVPPERASLVGRLGLAFEELVGRRAAAGARFAPALFGPVSLLVALVGAILAFGGARREGVLCGVWAAVILAAWVALTHLPGRFAIPLLIPASLLVGFGLLHGRSGWQRLGFGGLVWVVCVLNALQLLGVYRLHERYYGGAAMQSLAGATRELAESNWLSRALPSQARVWLIGDAACYYVRRPLHYTVVFSRDPWIEYARDATPREAVQWLRERDYTHVAFVWPEVERLRATYGFSSLVTHEWVGELAAAGLSTVAATSGEALPIGVELYRVEAPR